MFLVGKTEVDQIRNDKSLLVIHLWFVGDTETDTPPARIPHTRFSLCYTANN